MRFKFITFFLVFLFSTSHLFAKPRCENLYDAIYNDTIRTDVNKNTIVKEKNIGIRLETYQYEPKGIFMKYLPKYLGFEKLKTDKEGYFSIGQITSTPLYFQLKVGDIILRINGIDLRELAKDKNKKKIMIENISNLFKAGETIEFEVLRKGSLVKNKIDERWPTPKNQKIVITDRVPLRNMLSSYNSPNMDFFVNSINIDEKDGTFDASLDINFYEKLDNRYFLTKAIWDNIVYKKKFENKKLINFSHEQCFFSEERFKKLNTVDPKHGVKFDNIVQEYKHLRNSSYKLHPLIKREKVKDKKKLSSTLGKNYTQDNAIVQYKSSSVYKIKNEFNLRAFPFDKQKLKIYLRSDLHGMEGFRANISSRTLKKAMEFRDSNSIQGWNIKSANAKYTAYDNPIDLRVYDGITLEFGIERKSGYYIAKIILPILLILIICWSAVWIDPKEIESRLTITIVCLLSLIAYNFVIDSDLPKLEYLTIMDYIILISYIYAAIPNFLSIYSFQLMKKNKTLVKKYESYEKKFGLPSYILIVFLIIIFNATSAPEYTNAMISWTALK